MRYYVKLDNPKSELPAGALIFVHETTWFAKTIQLYEALADRTGIPLAELPNHVAVVGLDGRVVSPDPIGVVRRRVEKWFKPGNMVFMATLKGLPPESYLALAAAAENQVGKIYDYGGFLGFLVRPWVQWTGCLLPSWFPQPDPDRPFCSEMAAELYAKVVDYRFLCSGGPLGASDCTPADMFAETRRSARWAVEQLWPKTIGG